MNRLEALNPLTLPLHGIRLIEASAGTGKTWTLAALYLRMVLGHGGQPAQPPARILVVTFTRAATAELRERIRDRLASAAAAFRGQHDADPFLQSLLADYPDAASRSAAARQLEVAAQWMDEAAIYTIHGWSQRMLVQHAFDGGDAQDEVADDAARLGEAVRDYWRSFYAGLPRADAQQVIKLWRDPSALQRALRPLLRIPASQVRVASEALPQIDDLQASLRQHGEAVLELEANARALWLADFDQLSIQLIDAASSKRLSNVSYKPAKVSGEMENLRAWLDGEEIDDKLLERYTQAALNKAIAKNQSPIPHPAFDATAALLDARADQPPLQPLLLAHALRWVQARLERIRQREATLGFDDMLSQLDRALSGDGGAHLAHTIAEQYPLALIDEFQDTDPLQWHIFQRIYSGRRQHALLLIGDPKQAIYAFRGADIHTYLKARDQAQEPTWTLNTNYRSVPALVQAVNRLFEHADTHVLGAFGFGHGAHSLPFHAVKPVAPKRELISHGQPLPAMQIELLSEDEALGSGEYSALGAAQAAAQTLQLLQGAQQGEVYFEHADGSRSALRPRDIAVLVRSGSEAAQVRAALHQRGIASVYLSERDSVYAAPEAPDVLRWLHACAMPASDRAMRAALATVHMRRSLVELDRLNHDETYWEQCSGTFRQLHATWQRHGVLAMLHNLLHAFELPARLLAQPQGERALTNLQHLAELLQQEAAHLDGEQALIRYLSQQIERAQDPANQAADEQIVRLESESDLVKLITIHKSKGLQYPVVLLPFLCRASNPRNEAQAWHDDNGTTLLDLQPDDDVLRRIERERLQEDLRLLYVALTRAEHACWLSAAVTLNQKTPMLPRSAFGYVLNGGQPVEPAQLRASLLALRGDANGIVLTTPAFAHEQRYQASQPEASLDNVRDYRLPPPASWWIASYSALAHHDGASARVHVPDTANQDVLSEAARDDGEAAIVESSASIHAFPRGAEPGTFLHDLFEWAAEVGFAHAAADHAALSKEVARRCERRGWPMWITTLSQWLPQLLHMPLTAPDGARFALSDLRGKHAYQSELEFWFEAHRVDTQQLDRLICNNTLDGAPRPALAAQTVNGMLKGFIDLIVEWQGRYYVIDYKSNWLGDNAAAYTTEAMREVTLRSRYELQYAIYTLALHRQLQARLPGYNYEQHMGGVLYLYLRGVDTDGHGVHTDRLPLHLIEAMDRLFATGARDVA